MDNYKVRNDGIVYLDDGGAAKGSDRLIRRRRQRLIDTLKYPIVIGVILVIVLRGGSVKEGIIEQRKRTNLAINSIIKNRRQHVGRVAKDDDEEEGSGSNDGPEMPKYRWASDSILPPVHGEEEWARKIFAARGKKQRKRADFKVRHGTKTLDWEEEADKIGERPPKIDYTTHEYEYPDVIPEPPRGGSYPPFETLGDLLKAWPQNDVDTPPFPFVERLQHFDFTDPKQLEMAKRYRDIEFPFKLTNVPELIAANAKWTDDYLTFNFDRNRRGLRHTDQKKFEQYKHIPASDGHCQEGVDSFFAFFNGKRWDTSSMGPPPTLDNDFTFTKWSKHARYADSARLDISKTHYYYQAGVNAMERGLPKEEWTMISVDLPSFSDPEPNFISFNPAEQKGIQCRFGERGVTAATHYDGGRNMVGMITGAKRYILAPPKECSKVSLSCTYSRRIILYIFCFFN